MSADLKEYTIGRVFRNEGVDTDTILSLLLWSFIRHTDYYGMMDLREYVQTRCSEVCGTTCVPYGDVMIDLGKPFERMTMIDAVKKHSALISHGSHNRRGKGTCRRHHIEYEARHKRGDILNLFLRNMLRSILFSRHS